MSKKWICSTDSSHEFDSPTADLFCPKCPPYVGVLMEVTVKNTNSPASSNMHLNTEIKKGIGLYMFLIDASGSMFYEDAFPNVPMKRARLVSGQVASAIFEMENLTNKDNAYLSVMCFDHTLKPFINFMNVREVFDKFGDVKILEEKLFDEMSKMQGATDINLALKTAYYHAQRFIDGEMDVVGNVEPMVNSVFNPNTGNDFTVPNVRCLIFTDGEQYTGDPNDEIEGNPFDNFTYNGSISNILMGAYHGTKNSKGYQQLKSIMGNCPIHDEPQFFHFSEASQTMRMRYLFRMGSGPGGFCEKCLTQFITDKPLS